MCVCVCVCLCLFIYLCVCVFIHFILISVNCHIHKNGDSIYHMCAMGTNLDTLDVIIKELPDNLSLLFLLGGPWSFTFTKLEYLLIAFYELISGVLCNYDVSSSKSKNGDFSLFLFNNYFF